MRKSGNEMSPCARMRGGLIASFVVSAALLCACGGSSSKVDSGGAGSGGSAGSAGVDAAVDAGGGGGGGGGGSGDGAADTADAVSTGGAGGAPAGVGGAGGVAGAAGATGAGGATCGALGQSCCAGSCSDGLRCLGGATCSCGKALFGRYLLRTDGAPLLEGAAASTAQTPILNATTGLPLTDVKAIQDGFVHGCAVLGVAQTAWCWRIQVDGTSLTGNESGQLGDGTMTTGPFYRATQVLRGPGQPLANVTAIAGGAYASEVVDTSCAVTQDGRLYCWGDLTWVTNNGTFLTSAYAAPVTTDGATPLTGVLQVAVGPSYTCALVQGASVREVWCWGENRGESLGLGDATKRPYPTRVLGLVDPIKVVLADSTTCVLEAAGGVRCWGYNGDGAVGVGNVNSPVHAPTVVTLMGGTTALTGIVDIIATSDRTFGDANVCALKNDNSLLCWGGSFNTYPSLYGVTNVVSVGAADGAYTSSNLVRALSSDGLYHVGATTRTPNCGLLQ